MTFMLIFDSLGNKKQSNVQSNSAYVFKHWAQRYIFTNIFGAKAKQPFGSIIFDAFNSNSIFPKYGDPVEYNYNWTSWFRLPRKDPWCRIPFPTLAWWPEVWCQCYKINFLRHYWPKKLGKAKCHYYFLLRVNSKVKKCNTINTWGLYHKTYYGHNLRISVISQSVCPWPAFQALYGVSVCR